MAVLQRQSLSSRTVLRDEESYIKRSLIGEQRQKETSGLVEFIFQRREVRESSLDSEDA